MEKAHVTVNRETTTLPDSAPFVEDIRVWQQQLVLGVFRAVALVGPLAILAGSYYAYLTNVPWLIPAYFLAYGILLLITFWQGASYNLQAGTLLCLIYALGILDFLQDGQGGSGRLFLLTFLVVAALLFGRRGGILALVISVITILGFGLGFSTGQIVIPVEREVSSTNWAGWLSNTFVWILMGALLLVSQNYLIPRLVAALTRNRRLAQELAKHQAELEEQVADRTTALEQRSAQLEAAAQVAREATAIRDVGELLDKTVALVSEHFGFYHAGIFLLDEADADAGAEYAVLRAASSEGGQRMIARGHKLRVGQTGFVGSVAGTGRSRIAHNVTSRIEAPPDSIFGKHGLVQDPLSRDMGDAEDTASFSIPELPLTRSEMALPLKAHGQVIGVLDVHSTQAAAFSEEDKAILQILADQVALAIENARLLNEAEKRFHEMDILLGRHGQEGWRRLATERPRWGYTYDGTSTMSHETDYEIRTELKSQLTVPLEVRGATIGDMKLDLADQPLTPETEALAQAVAEQASQALENARLFQAAQRSLKETEILYRASQAIGAADSAEKVGQALIEYAAASGVDAARILLFEHDIHGQPVYMVMREGWTVDDRPAQPYGTRLLMEDYPLANLLNPNVSITIKDILVDSRANETARTFLSNVSGLRAIIMTPITIGGRWIGMLSAGLSEPFTFPEELVRGYETLSGQAAVALEGIRLLQDTRQRAERERLTGEITARMRETLDVDTVLQTAVREMRQVLGLHDIEIRLQDANGDAAPSVDSIKPGQLQPDTSIEKDEEVLQ
ncbi:MAG: GAF domain-containing protein [Chloroflexi bacterium]|nr:GAF domain-containing protein [Chloroflexota bacterium]